jgi:hypothetical protein
LKEEAVEEIVQLAWARASSLGRGPKLMEKANAVHADLHTWDREVLKKPTQCMKKLKKELENLRRAPMTNESIAAQKEILSGWNCFWNKKKLFGCKEQEQIGSSTVIEIQFFSPLSFSSQKKEYGTWAS